MEYSLRRDAHDFLFGQWLLLSQLTRLAVIKMVTKGCFTQVLQWMRRAGCSYLVVDHRVGVGGAGILTGFFVAPQSLPATQQPTTI